jgi:hydrogenase maturation factor
MGNSKNKNSDFLPLGKLKIGLLKEIFQEYNSSEVMGELNEFEKLGFQNYYKNSKNRVKMGFAIGEDAAVIDMETHYLVSKTDPITFATDEIGYYVVNVNANDIVTTGAIPKWFQATILLPESRTTAEMAKGICIDIQRACLKLGICLIGGHTEVTYGLSRPIVIGSMMGEVSKENYVETCGGKPGDAIILTKGIPLEGTSLLAREKEDLLEKKGLNKSIISKAKSLLHDPGISVMKEALLAVKHFNVHTMHDPTEGGLAMAMVEMAKASNCGFKIRYEDIQIIPEGKIICDLFNLDPLSVLSSGSLLIGIEKRNCEPLLDLLHNNGIEAGKIGNFTATLGYKIEKNGTTQDLKFTERDEITKIL